MAWPCHLPAPAVRHAGPATDGPGPRSSPQVTWAARAATWNASQKNAQFGTCSCSSSFVEADRTSEDYDTVAFPHSPNMLAMQKPHHHLRGRDFDQQQTLLPRHLCRREEPQRKTWLPPKKKQRLNLAHVMMPPIISHLRRTRRLWTG